MTIVSFQHAGRTDRGARAEQEDAYCVRYFLPLAGDGGTAAEDGCGGELVAVLADGMGGHVGGAAAARKSCSTFLETYPHIKGGAGERLVHALDASNQAIAAAIEDDQGMRGMGCTLLAVSLDPAGLRWISVGDSLLYLYRHGRLLRLNEDHSLAPILDELVEQGEMTAFEAGHHPKRNMLRSAVTGGEIKLVDLNDDQLVLQSGDWLILASDGLLALTEAGIVAIMRKTAEEGADRLAETLIDAVRSRDDPEQDNTTILIIGYHEDDE